MLCKCTHISVYLCFSRLHSSLSLLLRQLESVSKYLPFWYSNSNSTVSITLYLHQLHSPLSYQYITKPSEHVIANFLIQKVNAKDLLGESTFPPANTLVGKVGKVWLQTLPKQMKNNQNLSFCLRDKNNILRYYLQCRISSYLYLLSIHKGQPSKDEMKTWKRPRFY